MEKRKRRAGPMPLVPASPFVLLALLLLSCSAYATLSADLFYKIGNNPEVPWPSAPPIMPAPTNQMAMFRAMPACDNCIPPYSFSVHTEAWCTNPTPSDNPQTVLSDDRSDIPPGAQVLVGFMPNYPACRRPGSNYLHVSMRIDSSGQTPASYETWGPIVIMPNQPPAMAYSGPGSYRPGSDTSLRFTVNAKDPDDAPSTLDVLVQVFDASNAEIGGVHCLKDGGACAPKFPGALALDEAGTNRQLGVYAYVLDVSAQSTDLTVKGIVTDPQTPPGIGTMADKLIRAGAKPNPPVFTSSFPDPVPNIATITLNARQNDMSAGNPTKHHYKIFDKNGVLQFESQDIPITPDRPPTTGTTSFTFTCTPQKCTNPIYAHVHALNDQQIASEPDAILPIEIDDGTPRTPALVSPYCKIDNNQITAYAQQPNKGAKADKHRYYVKYQKSDAPGDLADWPGSPMDASPLDSERKTGMAPLTCDDTLCAHRVYVSVSAVNNIGESAPSQACSVDFSAQRVPAPTIKSIRPENPARLAKMQKGESVYGFGKDETIAITFNEPYTYDYSLLKSGQTAPKPTETGVTVTISCSALGCKDGDSVQLDVNARRGRVQAYPTKVLLVVPPAQAAGISATNPLCKDASALLPQIMGIGLAGIAVVIALAYMLGNAFSHPQLLDWAKTEALQVLMGFVIFVLILWLIHVECSLQIDEFAKWMGVSPQASIFGRPLSLTHANSDHTVFNAAQFYIEWSIDQTHLLIAMIRHEMGMLNIRASFNNFLPQMTGIGGNGYSNSPFSGDWTTIGTLNMLLNLNSSFLLSALMQFFSLMFFSSGTGLILFLVPAGILMRSVPFMRPVGSTLVAIGVGLYIFYPMVLAVSSILLPILYDQHDASDTLAAAGIGGGNPAQQAAALDAEETSLAHNGYGTYTGGEDSLPSALLHGANDKAVNLSEYFRLTALNFMRTVLMPTVGMLLTVVFIRDLAAIMGEEVDASKLVQMV